MQRLFSSLIRLPALRTAPALALLEALIGMAVLALSLTAFLTLLSGARSDLSRARDGAKAASLATSLMREARLHWPDLGRAGESNGLAWTRQCSPGMAAPQARLLLVHCTLTIATASNLHLVFETSWTAPRPDFSAP